jgi:hypothetical protein
VIEPAVIEPAVIEQAVEPAAYAAPPIEPEASVQVAEVEPMPMPAPAPAPTPGLFDTLPVPAMPAPIAEVTADPADAAIEGEEQQHSA